MSRSRGRGWYGDKIGPYILIVAIANAIGAYAWMHYHWPLNPVRAYLYGSLITALPIILMRLTRSAD